ncbi:hypothetical protein HQ45_06260 [Porphyromonas crevioricanis]|uniref:PKD domain-containing protein n=1 Tax=Porphyromonas crevioricanis TaxID=393921 RepID=UPI00052DB690|nr:PKD domain-containing protein [Porphyromonas crevioricanis]KGN90358.1 hypothetical protein HQ45_06260 [Porphyromonas crevioricanis]
MKNLLVKCNRAERLLWGALSLFLILLASPRLVAQQASDLKITTTVKDSKCGGSDGEVKIEVAFKPGHGAGHTIRETLYQLRNSNGNPMAPSADYVVGDTFLVPVDTYTPQARVSFENGTSVDISGSAVQVKTTYVEMTSVISVERKSLNHYKPNGQQKPTGILSLYVKDGTPPYTAKMLKKPATWTGPTEFSLEANQRKFIYEVPVGEYEIQISDGCKSGQAVTVNMEYVRSDLPKGGESDFPYGPPYLNFEMKKSNCGWVVYYHNKKAFLKYEEETRDIYPYINDQDTLAKYYDYAFQTIQEFKNGTPRTYYAAGTYKYFSDQGVGNHGDSFLNLYYRVSTAENYQTMWLKDQYWPLVFLRVKGSSQEMSEGHHPYKKGASFPNLIEHYPEKLNANDPCNDKYYLRIRPNKETTALMCYPLKVVVRKKGSPDILETYADLTHVHHPANEGGAYQRLKTVFDPTQHYELTITDAGPKGGSKQILDIPPKENVSYQFRGGGKLPVQVDWCKGKNLVDLAIRRVPVPVPMRKHKITFVKAPAGFSPLPGAMRVGETYTMPDDYIWEEVRVLSPKGEGMKDLVFYDIPEGDYEFKVEICDKVYNLKVSTGNLGRNKYSEDPRAFTPRLTKEECGYARFYPFAGEGGRKFLLKNDVGIESNLYISQLPEGIKATDIRTNLTGRALGIWKTYTTITAEENPKPEDIYLDIPATNDKMEVRLVYVPNGKDAVLECLPPHTIDLANAALSYDREKYIGYICSTKKSGLIRVNPINYIGDVTVQLFDRNESSLTDDKKLGEVKLSLSDLNAGKGAEFKLKEGGPIPIDPEGYKMKIMDDACKNTSEERLIVYSLPLPTVIKTEGDRRKYCEGETIDISIVALNTEGDDAYKWTLPDGNSLYGRRIRLENVKSNLSGTFKVEVSGIVCDDVATVETITFPISVAPRLLWWRKDAINADWHNVKNWADKNGNPVNAVPAECTTVHIPATVDKAFPDLGGKTDRTTYGQPECEDLYLHYGSQLGNPHHLTYEAAYVDYNFGKINDTSHAVEAHREPHFEEADSKLMDRDRWYMIAAPLKEIFSGDFGLAGYPKTHQRYLKVVSTGTAPTDASFKKPINSLVELLSDHNGAMALKVGKYQADVVGYNDHKYLNQLNGIIRIPFFEDFSTAYPLHSYDSFYKISTFGYFNENTLQPVNRTDQRMRSDEVAYRFTFEENNKRIGTVDISGVVEEGYALMLKEGLAQNEWFMVGNPFMTPINFDKLYEINKDRIHPYYYIFDGGTKSWKHYSKNHTATSELKSSIAPLQSVVLHKKSTEAKLLFPVGKNSVLLDSWNEGADLVELRSTSGKSEVLPLSVRVSNVRREGTISYLSWEENGSVPALSNSEYSFVPTVFFVDPETAVSNVVESPTKAYGAFALGVEATLGGEMELSFDQLDRSVYEQLTLIDKMEGKEQDLLSNSLYRFVHQPSDHPADRFILKVKRFGIENEPTQLDNFIAPNLFISRRGDHLHVSSTVGLRSAVIFDMQGRRCGEWQFTGSTNAYIDIDSNMQGVVMIDLRLQDGSRRICKFDTAK